VDAIAAMLEDRNRDVRYDAVRVLGVLGDSRAVGPLTKQLQGEPSWLSEWVVDALVRLQAKSAAPQVAGLLKAEDFNCRTAAARALGVLGSAEHVPMLRICLKDTMDPVAAAAAISLARLEAKECVPELIDMLGGDQTVVVAAIEALGILKAKDSIPALTRMMDHRNPNYRIRAYASLGLIGEAAIAPVLCERIGKDGNDDPHIVHGLALMPMEVRVPQMKALLKHEQRDVRAEAMQSLLLSLKKEALPIVEPVLAQSPRDYWPQARLVEALKQPTAEGTIRCLKKMMESDVGSMHFPAAYLLAEEGEISALPTLRAARHELNWLFQSLADEGIRRLEARHGANLPPEYILPP
jgi:HEAT repeat protein